MAGEFQAGIAASGGGQGVVAPVQTPSTLGQIAGAVSDGLSLFSGIKQQQAQRQAAEVDANIQAGVGKIITRQNQILQTTGSSSKALAYAENALATQFSGAEGLSARNYFAKTTGGSSTKRVLSAVEEDEKRARETQAAFNAEVEDGSRYMTLKGVDPSVYTPEQQREYGLRFKAKQDVVSAQMQELSLDTAQMTNTAQKAKLVQQATFNNVMVNLQDTIELRSSELGATTDPNKRQELITKSLNDLHAARNNVSGAMAQSGQVDQALLNTQMAALDAMIAGIVEFLQSGRALTATKNQIELNSVVTASPAYSSSPTIQSIHAANALGIDTPLSGNLEAMSDLFKNSAITNTTNPFQMTQAPSKAQGVDKTLSFMSEMSEFGIPNAMLRPEFQADQPTQKKIIDTAVKSVSTQLGAANKGDLTPDIPAKTIADSIATVGRVVGKKDGFVAYTAYAPILEQLANPKNTDSFLRGVTAWEDENGASFQDALNVGTQAFLSDALVPSITGGLAQAPLLTGGNVSDLITIERTGGKLTINVADLNNRRGMVLPGTPQLSAHTKLKSNLNKAAQYMNNITKAYGNLGYADPDAKAAEFELFLNLALGLEQQTTEE